MSAESLPCKFSLLPRIVLVMPSANPRAGNNPADPAQVLVSARTGDPAALALLYEEHAGRLLAIAYRLLGSRDDAEDVVHDVFVGLPEALRRYEERGSFGGWLRTITARVALARLRETKAHPTTALDDTHAAPARSSDASLTLERALRTLSPSLRAVLVLKEIEGFSHAEIARMLDITVGASEVRLHRAHAALRAALQEKTP